MKKHVLAALCCLLGSHVLMAQNQPKVHFTAGTKFADKTPYKLVFYDEFDGTTLDRNKWRTFQAWSGMEPYENDHWEEGRLDKTKTIVLKDDNVVLDGGVCHLLFKRENTNVFRWDSAKASTGAWYTAKYSSSTLQTYFRAFNADHTWYDKMIAYNTGRFEARLQMPVFESAHSTFWTYFSPFNGVNEIDIAEAYGGGTPLFGSRRRTANGLHAWWDINIKQPPGYSLIEDDEDAATYPGQTWWDARRGKYFKQQDWHTYTCEWDTSKVSFFLDGTFVRSIYKYYTFHRRKSKFPVIYSYKIRHAIDGIVPYTADYDVYHSFVWNNQSFSNVQIGPSIDNKDLHDAGPGSDILGEMNVDYVKIWQRHPEADNHTFFCEQDAPLITGPSILCNGASATYTVSPTIPGGTFSSAWDIRGVGYTPLNINSSTLSSCNVTSYPAAERDFSFINYVYPKGSGCPDQWVTKLVDVGKPKNCRQDVFKVKLAIPGAGYYVYYAFNASHLLAPAYKGYYSPTTFEWTVHYGAGRTAVIYGQIATTSVIPSSEAGDLSWTLKITNACGSGEFSGFRAGATLRVTSDSSGADTLIHFFEANITDSALYEQRVYDRVANLFITDTSDTTAIDDMIGQIRLEELEPYAYFDSSTVDTNSNNTQRTSAIEALTDIYPNPVTKQLNIKLGSNYNIREAITVRIINLSGKTEITQTFVDANRLKVLDLKMLPQSYYILELQQGSASERLKISKQ